jgi:hypothetical protein
MIGNSGRFINTLPLILGDQPFKRFMLLSDKLYALAGQSYKINLRRLFEMIFVVMNEELDIQADRVKAQLKLDYARANIKGVPDYEKLPSLTKKTKSGIANKRQMQHG